MFTSKSINDFLIANKIDHITPKDIQYLINLMEGGKTNYGTDKLLLPRNNIKLRIESLLRNTEADY